MKACKDCKYLGLDPNTMVEECFHPNLVFKQMDYVEGKEKRYPYTCQMNRIDPDQCGPEARYFVLKEPKKPSWISRVFNKRIGL